MKKWKIPVSWEMYGEYEIEADSLQEAILKSVTEPLPENGEYVSASFQHEDDLIEHAYPDEEFDLDAITI